MALEPQMIEPAPVVEQTKPAEVAKLAETPVAAEPAKPVEAAPARTEATPLVGAEPTKVEEKPVTAAAPEPKDDKTILESAEPPVKYEPWKLPENVKLDETEATEFSSILGKARVSQEVGQQILDLYVKEVQRLPELQREVWNRTQEQWKESVRADPELGGNRIDTVLKTANSVISRFGGTSEERQKLSTAMKLTGAGNHPEIVRFLYRIGNALAESKPVPAPTPKAAPEPKSRAASRYGANGTATT